MATVQAFRAFLQANPTSVRTAYFWAGVTARDFHCVIVAKPSGRLGEWAELSAPLASTLVTACLAAGVDIGTPADVAAKCWRMRPGAE